MAFGQYARLSGIEEDQKLDEEMDSLLALPKVNPNQPREWLLIDAQGRTFHTLVCYIFFVTPLTIHQRHPRLRLTTVEGHGAWLCLTKSDCVTGR